ncbi:N-6 DNA methylase [Candidatus Omnitrophota bacterium]
MSKKQLIEQNLDDVFKELVSGKYTDITNGIILLLNLNNPYEVDDKGIIFNPKTSSPILIKPSNKAGKAYLEEVIETYRVDDPSYLKNYVKHKFTTFLDDKKKSNLGKYYTPEHLVDLIHSLVFQYIKKNSIVLDPAAGCGAFLEAFKSQHVIGADIDKDALYILNALGFEHTICDNSLLGVSRKKYDIRNSDHLITVGNPPYNDVTSLNKKFGDNAKEKLDITMDADIWSQDYGISFLRVYNKLKADAICVLHPLSYLVKKSNFRKLNKGVDSGLFKNKSFARNYILKNAVIFSSQEFPDTKNTPFPIVAALYIKDEQGMDYEYIRNFKFKILNDNRLFVLKNIQTIDDNDYVRKYPPPKAKKGIPSDIGLYMYNIRDVNSLLAKSNLTDKINYTAHITIDYKDLYKYAYLNCVKRYFKKDFKFGNLSPIVDQDELEKEQFLKDAFIIDTLIANQRLAPLDVQNKHSIIYEKSLLDTYKNNVNKYKTRNPKIYDTFISFVNDESPSEGIEELKNFIVHYLEALKDKMIPQNG